MSATANNAQATSPAPGAGQVIGQQTAKTSPKEIRTPVQVRVDTASRLRQIRQLVLANNRSEMSADVIICQIYMESRFDPKASSSESSAKGLMQLLKAPVRELYRLRELDKPRLEREPESALYAKADAYHASPALLDEATNIRTGTEYLQRRIDAQRKKGSANPIVEGFKDYRGLRNGIYYQKIKAAADKLSRDPENMRILTDMVS